jgi:uncharacterized protein (TIGR00661 family)
MARILYGVHATGRGHAMRALTVARGHPQHEFLFVSHGEPARMLGREFRVFKCPGIVTPVSRHRVQLASVVTRNVPTLAACAHWVRAVRRAAEDFKPDAALTDLEMFVPHVARRLGLPSLSVGNDHMATIGRIALPPAELLNWAGTATSIRILFSTADQYLIPCFYDVPLRRTGASARRVPPLLRDEVIAMQPARGDHVVAYQGHQTLPRFIEVLEKMGRPVHVYGMGRGAARGNLSFMEFDERAFLADLASCAYVICGGSHTLISEALHLGKPVLAMPVVGMFEQHLNSLYLERCGYGMQSRLRRFSLAEVEAFEQRLDGYRGKIGEGGFCGNAAAFAALHEFMSGRWRPTDRRT